MDERLKLDLPYGHFGRAEYLPEEGIWHFERALSDGDSLKPLGITRVVVSGEPSDVVEEQPGNGQPPSQRYVGQVKKLVKDHPEFYPAIQFLSPLLRVSEAVRLAVRDHDPIRGCLLAFSEIRSAGRHTNVPVAAVATGPSTSQLRVIKLEVRNHGWVGERYPYLQVPWLATEGSIWRDLAEPIQQVCFSRKSNPDSPLLTVRLLKEIHIFRLSHGKTYHNGGLGLDRLRCLSIDEIANNVFVDISFNPWFPQQVGVVDCDGKWTLLEFETRRLEKISKIWTGLSRRELSDESHALDDGWARIAWVHNTEIFGVCTRKQFTLYSIEDSDSVMVNAIYVDSTTPTEWNLDFLVLPGRESTLCLLDSKRIVVYSLSEDTEGIKVRRVAEICHFRDPNDLSLRLCYWREDDELNLMVQSNFSRSFGHYRVYLEGMTTTSTSPVEFQLQTDAMFSKSVIETHIQPVVLVTSPARSRNQTGDAGPRTSFPQYYIVTSVHDDGALLQTLFYRLAGCSLRSAQILEAPSWEKRASKPILPSSSRFENDAFINDGDLEPNFEALMVVEPSAQRRRRPASLHVSKKREVNLELIARQLSSPSAETRTIDSLAAEIKDILASQAQEERPFIPNLAELCGEELVVNDVQAASTLLEDSMRQEGIINDDDVDLLNHDPHVRVTNIAVPRCLQSCLDPVNTNISSTFDHLVDRWIGPLPAQISGRVRLAKVSIARQTAAELVLASKTLRPQEKSETQPLEPPENVDIQPQSWTLPVRELPPRSTTSQTAPDASVLPTPSPTGTPSLITESSGASFIHTRDLTFLKKYAAFEKGPPLELPRSLRNVLAHWDTSQKLDDYDWTDASRKLLRQNEAEDEEMTEKERRRAQRRAERHLHRQRKEAAASEAQRLAESQATEIFSASQPSTVKAADSRRAVLPSSSQSQSQSQDVLPASQILPGRFGGRPPKRKKRKVGF